MSDDYLRLLITLTVPENEAGMRLDRWLAGRLVDVTLEQVRQAIQENRVKIASRGGRRPEEKVHAGDEVAYEPGDEVPIRKMAETQIPFDVIHEDAALAVLNKPAGVAINSAAGARAGKTVADLARRFGSVAARGEPPRPGIANPLDQEASGLVLLGRNRKSWSNLAEVLEGRAIELVYTAVLQGTGLPPRGKLDQPIGPHPLRRRQFTSRTTRGTPAETRWFVHARSKGLALAELTTRTLLPHQVRVHLSEHGHPIVGDPLYAKRPRARTSPDVQAAWDTGRLLLHATMVTLVHPGTGERARYEAPLPEAMGELVTKAFSRR